MRGRKITTAALGVLALLLCPAAYAASVTTELQTAVQLYGAQNYDGAIMHLAFVVSQEPSNAEAHYLLGCCYMRKNLSRDANREYETAAKLDLRGQVGVMARAALKSLSPDAMMSAATAATRAQPSVKTVAPSAKVPPSSVATAGSIAPASHPPANSIGTALSLIKDQATAEKQRHHSLGDAHADAEMATGNGAVAQLKVEKQATIEYMRAAVIIDNTRGRIPKFSDAQIQTASDSYDERISLVLAQAKEQAEGQRKFAAARVSDMDQVVDNLSSQMNLSHGVKLLPKGTNLYVRMYGQGTSSHLDSAGENKTPAIPEQLSASQDKLILTPVRSPGKTVSHVVPAPLAAAQDKLHLRKGVDPQLDVHGRITHM